MNKYKNLAMNTMVFAIGSFGSKILLLLLTRLYTHNIASGDNATKYLLENTSNIIVPIVTLSNSEAEIRYGLDKAYDNKSVFTSAVRIDLLGACVLLLLSPLFQLLPYTSGYCSLLTIYIMTSSFRQLCSQFVRARGLVKLFAIDGILATLTLFVYNVIFISMLQLGVTGFMVSVILSDFGSGVFLILTARLWKFYDRKSYKKEITRQMLRFSVPMIPTAVLWIITGFSDRLFITYMDGIAMSSDVGATAAGVYDASAKVPNLVSMVSTIFFQAWNMSAITENDSEDRSQFYYQIFSAYQSIMSLGAGFLILFVYPLSSILIDSSTDSAYANAYHYTPILIIGVLMMSYNQFLSSIYTATQHTTHSFWTSLVAAATNLVLNVVLIYRFGVQGAVIATFMSYFVCYLIRIVDARRFVPFKVNHIRVAVNVFLLFVMSFLAITEPSKLYLYQTAIFFLLCGINYQAILDTLKKLRKKG